MIRIDYNNVLKVNSREKFSLKEAEVIVGVCRKTLYKLLRCGAIETTLVGKRKKITGAALSRFVESLPLDPIAVAITK